MQFQGNKYSVPGLILLQLLFSCTKVIEVKVPNSTPQIVITGEVIDQPGPYKVTISKSVNYASPNNFPTVSGALVSIKGNGITDTLSEVTPGNYYTHTLLGRPGFSYSLFVSVLGNVYTATSIMPQPVPLDSIVFLNGRNPFAINAAAYFQDPVSSPNYYLFIELAHGRQFNDGRGTAVFDDRLSNGRYVKLLINDDSTDINSGDLITMQMKCIDKPVYDYFNELIQLSGAGGIGLSSPTPSNPTSNITGGALGYFSANTIRTKSRVAH